MCLDFRGLPALGSGEMVLASYPLWTDAKDVSVTLLSALVVILGCLWDKLYSRTFSGG